MKRILSIVGVVGVVCVTAWLIYSLVTDFGTLFPNFPKVEYLKFEYPKVEQSEVEWLKSESSISPDCDPFNGMDLSLIFLSIREDSMLLPVYLKTEGVAISGLSPLSDTSPSLFHAILGDIKSNSCGLQEGFDDRIYCLFTLGPDNPGQLLNYQLYREGCEEFVFMQPNVSVPELKTSGNEKPQCKRDLNSKECVAAGGKMSTGATTAPTCICP
jgi:hypothetical protein